MVGEACIGKCILIYTLLLHQDIAQLTLLCRSLAKWMSSVFMYKEFDLESSMHCC